MKRHTSDKRFAAVTMPPVGSSVGRLHHRSIARAQSMRRIVSKRRKREYFATRASDESVREYVERNLNESYAGYLFEVVMAVLSVFMVMFYVATNWNGLVLDYEGWIEAIDFNVNVLFTFEYLLRLYAAYDRVDYLRNFLRMVEFLVLLPSWMDFAGRVDGATLPATTLTQAIHGLRPLRILRSYRFLDFTTSSLQRQIVAAMLTVVCITISTAGILQVVEHCSAHECFDSPRTCGCQNLTMLDFIYFVVVSISTLGYGDITPESPVGKFLIAFIILLTFLLVPIQVNRIGAIVSSHTDYSSSYTEFKHHPHVVITGHIEAEMLSAFVREFFHASNLNWNEKIVILNTRPPTVEIKKLINLVDGKIKYLVGSPMLDEDLERAVIHRASACFVLVNRNARRAQYADQCTALITIALRRGNPTCPIYAQVINAQNSSTILKMGASDVIVEGLMKSSILGRSCEVYGLPTLLSNLLSQSHPDMDKHHSSIQWQKPYLHGYLHNIYMVDIPRTFSGYTFGDLIRFLFEKAAVLPIAMLTENGVQFIDLEFKLGATADPNLCCKVYALAKGHAAIDQIMEIPPEQILSYRKTLRRKAMSEADPLAEEQQVAERKKIKPALGSELELIREAMISMYAIANKFYSEDTMNADYEEFISIGVPPSIEKHIIVCGFPADTFQFLKTIHEAPPIDDTLGPPSVVFLAPAELDEDEYAKIQCFCQVYFVLGSPVNFADLRRTRIETASSVLILTKATGSAYADPNMVDADAITTLRYIVEISQRTRMPNLVVELERATNVKLLSSLANDRRVSASATLPVTVSRQLSYRTARRASVRRDSFWSGADDPSSSNVASSSSTIMLEEYIASGRVYMNSILDSLLSECYRKEWITQVVCLLVNGRAEDPYQRRLFQVEVPDELVSLRFIEVFRKLLDLTGSVCLGFWRPERGIILPHPCVFICPEPDFQVEPHDQLYLVGKPFTVADAQEMWAAPP